MAKYSKRHPQANENNQQEAMSIAKGIQRPGQTKEQTKLVAQGIQKGIELYKKQHKAKARELDKKLKAVSKSDGLTSEPELVEVEVARQHWLPWVLLVASWIGFTAYLFVST